MPPKTPWLIENSDKILLAGLMIACIVGATYAEHYFKDDGVFVGFWMGLTQNFQGAIIAVITGKVMAAKSKETASEGGTITNLNIIPPEPPKPNV